MERRFDEFECTDDPLATGEASDMPLLKLLEAYDRLCAPPLRSPRLRFSQSQLEPEHCPWKHLKESKENTSFMGEHVLHAISGLAVPLAVRGAV